MSTDELRRLKFSSPATLAAHLLKVSRLERVPRVVLRLLLSLAIAGVVFGITLKYTIVDPTHVNWLLRSKSDLDIYFFSFVFYRRAPWAFPITHIQTLFHPVGSSLIVMDGLPLAAVPLKLLAPLLPDSFQFLGLWLLLCIWLQTFFAERMLRTLALPPFWSWAGAVMCATAPPFIARFGHVALSSHWVLLCAIGAACAESPGILMCAAPALALWIHPYLFAMVLALSAAGQLRFARTRGALVRALSTILAVAGSMWILGYFEMSSTRAGGFERYASDLSSLFNSMGTARLLPSRPLGHAWEGSAYLGVGGLAAGLGLLVVWCVPRLRRESRQNYWLLAACIAMALYSLTSSPRWLGEPLTSFDRVAQIVQPIALRFRSAGRFVWPLYYYILLFGLKSLHLLASRARWLQWSVATLVGIQLIDIWPLLVSHETHPDFFATDEIAEVPDTLMARVTPQTRLMIFVPPVKSPCGRWVWHGPYQRLALFAASHGLITNANLGEGRSSWNDTRAVCNYTLGLYRHQAQHPEAIFVTPDDVSAAPKR